MALLSRILVPLLRVRPHEVELLRPAARAVPLAWALFACGAAALAAAAWACQPGWDRQAELAQQRQQLEAALGRAGVAPGAASHRTVGKGEALDEARAIVIELHRPWHELFDALETADADGVNLIQINVEPRFASLQLVAESRDLDKLVRFSQKLAGSGPIRSMTMTHHEWRDALGAHVVSAAMQGELAGATPGSAGSTP
jgi:hypothetical protein